MIKEKFNSNDVLGIDYFYDLFLKKKLKFPKQFFFNIKTRKKTLPVEQKLHKQIISTYFDNYFFDLYHSNSILYFPLSGKLALNKGKHFFKNPNNRNNNARSIVWTWFERPSFAYFLNVKLLKLKGSTSKLNKMDEEYRQNNEVEELDNNRIFLKKNKLYIDA